jgi:hypothetical protein
VMDLQFRPLPVHPAGESDSTARNEFLNSFKTPAGSSGR